MKKLLFVFVAMVGAFANVATYAANNCTGATYYDSDLDTCIACPTGYDANTDSGKTSITQCQISCLAGTYVEKAGIVGYTQLEYLTSTGRQYINSGVYVDFSKNFRVIGSVINPGTSGRKVIVGNFINNADGVYALEFGGSSNSKPGYFRNYISASSTTDYWSPSALPANALISYDSNYNAANHTVSNTIEYDGSTMSYNFNTISTSVTAPRALRFFLDYRSNTSPIANALSIGRTKMYKDNILVGDFIPARRNSDNVLGLYDLVTGTFFTNSGTGTFIAGPDVASGCINVGAGYYAAASTTNFGSVGTRNACPAGTSTNGANNASSCTPCAGATYSDAPAAAVCTACPSGYDYNIDAGKTDITQCQIHCDAGTFTPGYTELEYIEGTGTQYIDTGIVPTNYNWSASFRMSASGWGKYFFGMGTTNGGGYWGGNGYQLGIAGSAGSSSWGGASSNTTAGILGVSQNVFYNYKMTKNGFYVDDVLKAAISSPADYVASSSLYLGRSNNPQGASYNNGVSKWAWVKIYDDSNTLVFDGVPVRRDSDGEIGMYDMVTDTFLTNAGTGTFTAGPDAAHIGGACKNVGTGYYAAASVTNYGSAGTRTACPAGMTTVGYGHGADSANDCARTLHVGDYVLYARRDKITTPSINIAVPNEGNYYVSLSPTDHALSRLHVSFDGNQYTAYDDSLFYGERDFDTGQQITQ